MNSYYGQSPQREENNNLGTALGLGLLGTGAAAAFGGPALFKNIKARRAKAKATGGPRGGQGGTATRDNPTAAEVYGSLGTEAKPTKGQVYDRVSRQPQTDFEYQEYGFPLRKASPRQTVVDTDTGEIIARGGPTAYYQQFDNVPTGNTKTPELYLSRPLDAYLESLPTNQQATKKGALAVIDSAPKTSLDSGPKLLPGSGPVPQLQSREQAVYGRAANKYPDPGVGKDVQYRFPSGGTDQSMLITDEATGQIFRRGGGLSVLEQQAGISEQPVVKTAAYEEGSAVDKLMKSLLPEVNKEAGQMSATESSRQTRALAKQDDQATQQMARGILSEMKEEQPQTLVQVQESREPLVAVNSMETVNTADDQSDGRFLRNLQRNEDVNMAAVSEAVVDNKEAVLDSRVSDALRYLRGKEIDTNFDYSAEEAIQARQVGQRFERAQALQALGNQVIEEVQAGTPGTTSAERFLTNERDEIASLLGEQGISITPSKVEQELGNRLGSEAYKYGPKYTKRKQAIQLGATYDPALFDDLAKDSVVIAGENIPTGRVAETKISTTSMLGTPFEETVEKGLREPTYMKETAERLQEKAENKKDWLGSVRLEAASESAPSNAELINTQRDFDTAFAYKGELENYLDSGRGSFSERTRAKQRLDDVNYELDRLDTKAEALTQQVYGGRPGARVRGAQKHTADYIENLTPPSKLKSGIEEGQRLFYELNPETGEPIPGTQELRSERRMVDMTPKGGGGRNVAEFSAGNRDEGSSGIDVENILMQARTPNSQSGREYTKDQLGYRPGTGLTGKPLEGRSFTDDRTQTGSVKTRTGIQMSGPQPGTLESAINPYTQLDNETLGMISLQGSEDDAVNASRVLARRRREGFDSSSLTGPGQSNRVVSSIALTPEQKQTKLTSLDVSRQIAALEKSGRPDAQQQVQNYLQQLRGGIS